MFRSMGLARSRLKIPIMDFASITYLPDTRSKSKSNLESSFTKDFTLSMEFKDICTFFMIVTSLTDFHDMNILPSIPGKVKRNRGTITEKKQRSLTDEYKSCAAQSGVQSKWIRDGSHAPDAGEKRI